MNKRRLKCQSLRFLWVKSIGDEGPSGERIIPNDDSTDNYLSLSGRYDWEIDAFALPNPAPQVQLGEHLRAVVITCPLRPNLELVRVSLECLSQEVVVGLLGLTVVA